MPETSILLDKNCKEPSELIFSNGSIFKYIFNEELNNIQYQKFIFFDLRSRIDLDHFSKIGLLLYPPGCKEVLYQLGINKQTYIYILFKKLVLVFPLITFTMYQLICKIKENNMDLNIMLKEL